MVGQGSSLTWMSIRIGLQGRKPRESNKLFDLFFPPQDTIRLIRPIRPIRGRKKNLSCGVLPSRQSMVCFDILAHLLRRCTRLLMVLPSRQRSDMCSHVSYEEGSNITCIRKRSGAWKALL